MNIFNFISRILQIRKLNTEEKRLEDSSQLQDYTQLHHKEIEEAKKGHYQRFLLQVNFQSTKEVFQVS